MQNFLYISLDCQTPSCCCFSQAVVSGLAGTYHPHHHVRKSCNPQGRRSKGDHEPFFQVGFVAVGHCEVEDKTQGPCEDPLQHFYLASCQTTKQRETITLQNVIILLACANKSQGHLSLLCQHANLCSEDNDVTADRRAETGTGV